jgi:Phage tail lysozyme
MDRAVARRGVVSDPVRQRVLRLHFKGISHIREWHVSCEVPSPMQSTSPRTKTLKLQLLALATLASAAAFASGCSVESPDGSDEDSATNGEALSSNEKAAYEFFVGKGLKNYEAAGIVGNLIQESSVSPTVKEYGGGPGRGIAQWSAGGRWDHDSHDNVEWYAGQHGQSATSLNLQLEFVWYELQTFSGYGLSELRGSSNVSSATVVFQDRFEGCGTCDQSNRIAYAKQVLSAYGSESPPPSKPTQAVAPKPTVCGVFKGGQGLGPKETLHSCDGRFNLIMQSDGNLVLYMGNKALWATSTDGDDGYAMWMQTDGNFVLYNPYEHALWAAGTNSHGGSTLHIQDDGNLVVYNSNGKALWASHTSGH